MVLLITYLGVFAIYRTVLRITQVVICRTVLRKTSVKKYSYYYLKVETEDDVLEFGITKFN